MGLISLYLYLLNSFALLDIRRMSSHALCTSFYRYNSCSLVIGITCLCLAFGWSQNKQRDMPDSHNAPASQIVVLVVQHQTCFASAPHSKYFNLNTIFKIRPLTYSTAAYSIVHICVFLCTLTHAALSHRLHTSHTK